MLTHSALPGGAPVTDVGWRRRLVAFRHVPAMLRLTWHVNRGYATATVVLRLVRALVPLLMLWISKLIIDAVVSSRAHTPRWGWIVTLLAAELLAAVASDVMSRASQLYEGLLGDLTADHMSVLLMECSARLSLTQFEDPQFYDRLDRARRNSPARAALLATLFTVAQSLMTLVTLAAALLAFSPVVFVLLVLATLPSFIGEGHFAGVQYALLFRFTPQRRTLDYLRAIGASDETVKEMQLFGLAPWIIGRFRRLAHTLFLETRQLASRRAMIGAALMLVSTGAYYAAYALIVVRAVQGVITVGLLVFLSGTFMRARDLIQQVLAGVSTVGEQALYAGDLFEVLEHEPPAPPAVSRRLVPRPCREGFQFERVSFRYPGSERWAVQEIDLTIGARERVALVGQNGSGKTTLVKLLAGLYEPTEGRILLDGLDLREYDTASLRQTISVVFQDFVKYDMRLDENIGVGDIERFGAYLDRERDHVSREGTAAANVPAAMQKAAVLARAESLIRRLPDGYEQMLGRKFYGGTNLSGGEWQKIALARAYLRDAQIVVLDEPTAALDARAEHEVFDHFATLVEGRMALLISHRFSTVRMADRIVVLERGRLLEAGSHDALLALDGHYAELFTLQAAGYR